MKFKSNSGKTLFMTIIIVFILVIIGAITYFGIISYPEVFNDIKVKVQQTFNKNEKNNTSSTSDTTSENNDLKNFFYIFKIRYCFNISFIVTVFYFFYIKNISRWNFYIYYIISFFNCSFIFFIKHNVYCLKCYIICACWIICKVWWKFNCNFFVYF